MKDYSVSFLQIKKASVIRGFFYQKIVDFSFTCSAVFNCTSNFSSCASRAAAQFLQQLQGLHEQYDQQQRRFDQQQYQLL
jgi:hypothetical protein